MAANPMIFVVIFLVLAVGGGLAWYFLFGPGKAAPEEPPVTPPPAEETGADAVTKTKTYKKYADRDHWGSDIECLDDGSNAEVCKAKCDADSNCKGYNYVAKGTVWGDKSGCCYKSEAGPLREQKGTDYYSVDTEGKIYTKYENKDVPGSDIECFTDGSPPDACKAKCDTNPKCKAYVHVPSGTVWGKRSGCCVKTKDGPLVDQPDLDFYVLNK